MNKEELKELAATLNGIADGKAWEFQALQGNWYAGNLVTDNPQRLAADGYKIRLKPWSLPPPPEGMQWHRDDWTEEMLEGGWRPQCLGEYGNEYEYSSDGAQWEEVTCKASIMAVTPSDANGFYRTKRPLPQPDPYAELKAAHAAGKKLQHRHPGDTVWRDCSVTDTSQDPYCFLFEPECYRIKPEQQKVPLQPSDVLPLSFFRVKMTQERNTFWFYPESLTERGITLRGTILQWSTLRGDYEINRSIPITGKWNPEAWEPCYKLIDKP